MEKRLFSTFIGPLHLDSATAFDMFYDSRRVEKVFGSKFGEIS